MTELSFTVPSDSDSLPLAVRAWPSQAADVRGVVQIAHGLAEHSARYARLAAALNIAGYHAYAQDHRGHGDSVGPGVLLGSFGAAGWDGLVADVVQVGAWIAAQHPGLPLFLVAHSMGSFASQQVMLDSSGQYAGVVLSGTTALDVMAASLEASPGGDLSAFNTGFENRTGYEWLSRDEAEVDAYVADPLCGFEAAPETMPAIFGNAKRVSDPAALAGIRSGLPVLLVSGSADPLAAGGELIQLVGQRYRAAGLADVTVKVYPLARHEIFNETNRDEITAFVIGWLDARLPVAAG